MQRKQPEKVLIVDDAGFLRARLKKTLEREEYLITEAGDGQAALDCVSADPPDLILLDIRMPVLDGLATLERLKARQETRYIPVIMVTASDDENQITEAFEIGAVDYIPKPFSDVIVRARVRGVLDRLRAAEMIRQNEARLKAVVGSIAHGFDNLLMSILGYSELALNELPPSSPAAEKVEQIRTAALRAAELSKRMAQFTGEETLTEESAAHFLQRPMDAIDSSVGFPKARMMSAPERG